MTFEWEGKKTKLKEDMSLSILESSLKAMVNSVKIGGEGFWLECKGVVHLKEVVKVKIKLRLRELLEEYRFLFRELNELSPKRVHDHTIRLLP